MNWPLRSPTCRRFHIRGYRTFSFSVVFALSVATQLIVCCPGNATSYPPTARPLSSLEAASSSVASSDAVVVATFVSARDSLGPSGRREMYLRASTIRWILGSGSPRLITIRVPSLYTDANALVSQLIRQGPTTIVCFLVREGAHWALAECPFFAPGGIARVEDSERGQDQLALIGNAASAVSDEQLSRSDLVAAGSLRQLQSDCTAYGKHTMCATFDVRDVVVGSGNAGTQVSVVNPFNLPWTPGDYVLVLHRLAANLYELAGFERGLMRLEQSQVKSRNDTEPIETFKRRWQQLRAVNR